jgi:signal transduction histidine kinase
MKVELNEIAFVLIAGTVLFVFLIFLLIIFFVIYQNRKNKTEREIAEQKNRFDKEILNAQTEIREETMKFISQELHDNIAQTLIVTNLTLNRITDENPVISQTRVALQHTINQVKLLSKALDTENILVGGLIGGLEFEINRLRQLERWDIDYFNEVEHINLTTEKQLLVFRIFQELITNIIKYGQAKSIMIELLDDQFNLILKMTDDGNQYDFFEVANSVGFKSGAGLKGIINRTQLLNANLKVSSNNRDGMTYNLSIPKI